MAKRQSLDEVFEPHRKHLQGDQAIPSIGEGEPVSDELALLDDLDTLARAVKRRERAAPWLDKLVITAFELGKRCGAHGAEDKLRFARKLRKTQSDKSMSPKSSAVAMGAKAQKLRARIRILNAEYDDEYGYYRSEESYDKRAGIFAGQLGVSKKNVLDHMRERRKAERSSSADES